VNAMATTQGPLRQALAGAAPRSHAADLLQMLVEKGLDQLPPPGGRATWLRWQALATVAEHDLSLVKLYEGHTDALAILKELSEPQPDSATDTWGVWAAEAPQGRTLIETAPDGRVRLRGRKCWCSGASHLSHGLLTAWYADGTGPQLVRVAMRQPGITIDATRWQAIGMAVSNSVDVVFDGALADLVGQPGAYLTRPGFWQGGAGIAACWYGGSRALAIILRGQPPTEAASDAGPESARHPFRLAALGKVDLALHATAAVLREAASWIDDHPLDDASRVALRARLQAESCASTVLDQAGRSLGAAAFCRDAKFARAAADLPVFVRQTHAERDFTALGERVCSMRGDPWLL
jgi:alkylation response protein AidB-like acyl-CoA dehydrogenase